MTVGKSGFRLHTQAMKSWVKYKLKTKRLTRFLAQERPQRKKKTRRLILMTGERFYSEDIYIKLSVI